MSVEIEQQNELLEELKKVRATLEIVFHSQFEGLIGRSIYIVHSNGSLKLDILASDLGISQEATKLIIESSGKLYLDSSLTVKERL